MRNNEMIENENPFDELASQAVSVGGFLHDYVNSRGRVSKFVFSQGCCGNFYLCLEEIFKNKFGYTVTPIYLYNLNGDAVHVIAEIKSGDHVIYIDAFGVVNDRIKKCEDESFLVNGYKIGGKIRDVIGKYGSSNIAAEKMCNNYTKILLENLTNNVNNSHGVKVTFDPTDLSTELTTSFDFSNIENAELTATTTSLDSASSVTSTMKIVDQAVLSALVAAKPVFVSSNPMKDAGNYDSAQNNEMRKCLLNKFQESGIDGFREYR